MAEHLVDEGRDPSGPLARVRAAVEAGRALGRDWPSANYFAAYADWLEASHTLAAGGDPLPTLARGEELARALALRIPSAQDAQEALGKLAATRALHLLARGENAQPALHEARTAFQRAVELTPWDLSFIVWRARVEILALHADGRGATEERLTEVERPLLALLADPRVDPRLYEAVAEVRATRAALLAGRGESPEGHVAGGLAMIEKALAVNPRMAKALVTRGRLLLLRARATRDPRGRAEAARGAAEAFASALRQNPLLDGDVGPGLRDARSLAGG
jgi:hypothetical protein